MLYTYRTQALETALASKDSDIISQKLSSNFRTKLSSRSRMPKNVTIPSSLLVLDSILWTSPRIERAAPYKISALGVRLFLVGFSRFIFNYCLFGFNIFMFVLFWFGAVLQDPNMIRMAQRFHCHLSRLQTSKLTKIFMVVLHRPKIVNFA